MQTKDIKIGEDYVMTAYRGIARVRVTEKGLQLRTWRDAKKNGVRIEVMDDADWHQTQTVVPSRDIVRPWDDAAQQKMDKVRAEIRCRERVELEAAELGVVAFYRPPYVQMRYEDWVNLVGQLRGLTAAADLGDLDLGTHMPEREQVLRELHALLPDIGYDNAVLWVGTPTATLQARLVALQTSSTTKE